MILNILLRCFLTIPRPPFRDLRQGYLVLLIQWPRAINIQKPVEEDLRSGRFMFQVGFALQTDGVFKEVMSSKAINMAMPC